MEIKLFTPGPTRVPERVRKACALPMIHHRSEEFSLTFEAVRHTLRNLCVTKGEVIVLSSSGSGAMEASISSLFAPGDEVVVIVAGKFGERWRDLAKHFDLKATVVEAEWGRAVSADAVMQAVTASTKGILIQACESSTGAYHPITEIGKRLQGREDILLVVDAITAVGIHDIQMDRDRIDVLIGASQKALMSPPGLAFVALGGRGLERLQNAPQRGFYFSLKRELKNQQKGTTAFTPAISLVMGLEAALDMISQEGRDALFVRHQLLQKMARGAFREMGLELYNLDDEATTGITVARAPKGMEVKSWLKELRKKYGLWLAGGQGEQLEGKIFRLSHMGYCSPEDLLDALGIIEESLASLLPRAMDRAGTLRAKEILKAAKST